MKEFFSHIRGAVVSTLVLAVVCSGLYPLIVFGISQALFHDKANGSLITGPDGSVRGSKLLGQAFSDPKYFHPRPSAAGSGYDPTSSGGTNLGPLSAKLLNGTTKPSTPTTAPAAVASAAVPVTQPSTTQPAVVVDFDGIKLRTVLYCQANNIDIVDASQPLKNFMDDK